MSGLTVACVLTTLNTGRRNGGRCYGPEWLWAIKRRLKDHVSGEYEFRYLSDTAQGPWRIPLKYDWPGWWAKMELFRPGVFEGLVLYVDLDTLIVGDLSDIAAYPGEFAMLADFNRPSRRQSGMMLFRPGKITEAIWEEWIRDPEGHMRRHRGDGEWLHSVTEGADIIQRLFPGQVVSFKRDARKGPPKGARIVAGHGRPRLSDPRAGWINKAWADLARASDRKRRTG